MKYCKKCGAELTEGVRFCEKCGNPVGQMPKQGNGKKKWVIAVSLGVIILAVATVGGLFATGVIGDKEHVVQTSTDTADIQETPSVTGAAVQKSEEDKGSDEYTVNKDGEMDASEENPGEAVMVSNTVGSDYFSSAKLTREQNRTKNKETLLEIINNESVASADKKAAVQEVAQITKNAEQENAAEMMLEAKGFEDAVVSISGDSADVIVNMEILTEKEMAQIEDIVKRKTDISAENIAITPVKVEKE